MNLNNAYDLLSEKLTTWGNEFIKLLPNIALAALVIIIGLFLSKIIRRFAAKLIQKVSNIEAINNLFASFIYVVAISITFFIALSILQLDKAVTSILAGAGIFGLALAFAFQDIAANFMSGIFISFRRPLHVGDLVKLNGYMGTVETISLRDTSLITFEGQRIIIPNKDIFQNPIENYTTTNRRRMDLVVGVSYGDDLEKVKNITIEAVKDISGRDSSQAITLFYTEFGDSSINFVINIWLQSPDHGIYLQARSEAIVRIKELYDQNDITIPFPIRTLDFGIKGGEKLSEMKMQIEDLGKNGAN